MIQWLANTFDKESEKNLKLFVLGGTWLIFLGTVYEIIDALIISFHKIKRNSL